MSLDANGLEILDRAECVALLATTSVGRIGVSVAALPSVFPVNFVVIDEQVVFRSGRGTKLTAASNGAVVAFEADSGGYVADGAWSVMLHDVAYVGDADDYKGAKGFDRLSSWGGQDADRVVVLGTLNITGRRIRHAGTTT